MDLTLDNFEQTVELKIVERGFEYFKGGYVSRLEKVGENEFSALVLGTYPYNIFVKLNQRKIVEYICDCPYDWGDTCKHAVAVFYSLKNGATVDEKIQREVERILNKLSDKQLREYFYNRLKKDWEFRNSILKDFDSDFADYEDERYW